MMCKFCSFAKHEFLYNITMGTGILRITSTRTPFTLQKIKSPMIYIQQQVQKLKSCSNPRCGIHLLAKRLCIVVPCCYKGDMVQRFKVGDLPAPGLFLYVDYQKNVCPNLCHQLNGKILYYTTYTLLSIYPPSPHLENVHIMIKCNLNL